MLTSALQHKSKYKSNSISNFFEKKNQIRAKNLLYTNGDQPTSVFACSEYDSAVPDPEEDGRAPGATEGVAGGGAHHGGHR